MKSALDPRWLPDRKLMAATSDWISDTLPWPLRWAPLFAIIFVFALAAAGLTIEIAVPQVIPVSISADTSAEPTRYVVLRSPMTSYVPEVGKRATVRISSGVNERISREAGTIIAVDPAGDVIVITLATEKGWTGTGSGILVVPDGSERLWDILLRKIKARGGR